LLYPCSAAFVVILSIALYPPSAALGVDAAEAAFLLAVVLIALVWGRGPAIIAALASGIMYNYVFIPPPYVFTVPTFAEAFLLAGLLAVATVLGTVTDRMRIARQELERLTASDHLQKTLLSSISHDLRTPLTAVIGSLSTLIAEGRDLEEGVRRELRMIAYEGARQLDRLLAQILEMTRLEAGLTQVRQEPGNLADVVGTALTQLRGTLNGRRCQVDLAPALPTIRMDDVLLSHALVNVLDNAIKYSPPESPIEVEAHPTDGWIVISVGDRGVGIPEADLNRVFERFYRVRHASNTASTPAGFGLGLAIAKGIVEAHGGQIWLEQRDGGGTVARVRLPLS
jgi:two-component system sensor histidine kinase KdpD